MLIKSTIFDVAFKREERKRHVERKDIDSDDSRRNDRLRDLHANDWRRTD